jgi:hypothetical protein
MERRLRLEAAKVPLLSRGAGIMPFLAARLL